MSQELSKRVSELKLYSRLLILFQIGGPFLLFTAIVLWEYTGSALWLLGALLFGFLLLISTLVIIMKQPKCPSCEKPFFTKGYGFNVGFSMYTYKCSNCGYKLKKGE